MQTVGYTRSTHVDHVILRAAHVMKGHYVKTIVLNILAAVATLTGIETSHEDFAQIVAVVTALLNVISRIERKNV